MNAPALILLGLMLLAAIPVRINYRDVAQAAGLTAQNVAGGTAKKTYILETTGNGVAIFDYDGDGRNDLFFANGTTLDGAGSSPRPSRLYHNEGGGHFKDVSKEAGFVDEAWAQGVCAGDFDNDGLTDLFVTYYGHNRLYRNEGNGRFRDVTARVGLPITGTRYGSGCTFADYDRDGRLDLFVSNYVDLDLSKTPKPGETDGCRWKGLAVMCGPRGLPLANNVLYHANLDGTFTDVTKAAGIAAAGGRYSLGAVAADFDNDGWPDLYIACDMTPSLFYRNKHDGTFEERASAAGVAYNYDGQLQAGMGIAVADYDGNGYLDIAKTNFSGDLTSLFNNEDGKFFSDLSLSAGLAARQYLGWGIAFLDADEDGWKDLVVANGHVYPEVDGAQVGDSYREPTLLYRNLGNGHFEDFSAQAGEGFRTPRAARGLAVGDLDQTGRQSIVIVNMNGTPSLLKNSGARQHSLVVSVAGVKSNRSGIGARITVRAGERTSIDEILSGGSYYSQNEMAAYFGLGAATAVNDLEVLWPSGLKQTFKNVASNQRVLVTEGSGTLKTVLKW